MKEKHITLAIWKWEGKVLAGGSAEQFAAFIKREIGAEIEVGSNSAGHAYVAYGQPWYLWVDSLDNVPTLAHEVFHVTTGVLEARGMKYSSAGEEAYTYTLEYIMREALNKKGWRRP
jgi:hypothetical protein